MEKYTLKFTKEEYKAIAQWITEESYGTHYRLYLKFVGAWNDESHVSISGEELNMLDILLAKQKISHVEAIANKLIRQITPPDNEARRNSGEKQSGRNPQGNQD